MSQHYDFTVIPSDDPDVREADRGFLTEISWTVTAPEGGKSHGVRRVLVPSTADAVVQLGSLYEPTEIPAVTAQRIIDGGTAAAPLYDIRIRHDDSAGWAAEDPILSLGEEGIDVDTGTRKVGDGVTAWSSLPASGGGGGGGVTVHSALTGRTAADQHPTSAITGLDAALAGKATAAQGTKADTAVQPARTITAGTGLTGGGDLSANRTLAVAYGTTSTTATVGNDSRVTGAAQKSANLSDLANASTARTNLGLGTAATTAATAYATATQGTTADAALAAAAAPELIRDTMAAALVAGANVTITPNDGADTITIAASGGGGGVTDFQSYPTPVGQYTPIVRAGGFTSAALSTTTQNSTTSVRLTPLVVSGDYSFDRIAQSINAASTEAGATIGLAVYSRTGELILDCGEVSALTTGLKTITIDLALSRGIYFTALRFRASTFAGVNPTFFWASQCDGLAVSNVPDSNNYTQFLTGFVLPSVNPFPSQITTWAFTSSGNGGSAPINLLRRSA